MYTCIQRTYNTYPRYCSKRVFSWPPPQKKTRQEKKNKSPPGNLRRCRHRDNDGNNFYCRFRTCVFLVLCRRTQQHKTCTRTTVCSLRFSMMAFLALVFAELVRQRKTRRSEWRSKEREREGGGRKAGPLATHSPRSLTNRFRIRWGQRSHGT